MRIVRNRIPGSPIRRADRLAIGVLVFTVAGCGLFSNSERASGSPPQETHLQSGTPVSSNSPSAGSHVSGTSSEMPPQLSVGQSLSLLFRAIVHDEDRNEALHAGENISIEIEVKNEGPWDAAGVEVLITGTPELLEYIPGVLSIGDIPAGEAKNVTLEGRVGAAKETVPAQLTLELRTKSPAARLPSAKKFLIPMKSVDALSTETPAVDVDEIAVGQGKLNQPKAIGVAVGIGRFRGEAFPRVKFAAQDAEVIAKYWNVAGGIPAERVRSLIDAHALKSDVAEVFEDWLPKHVDPSTVVHVFISGRGIVDSRTGTVSLVPYDGTATSSSRTYPLRRLQEILVSLPIERAIVMLDLSLEHASWTEESRPAEPVWDFEKQAKDKVMWMVGTPAVREAHTYEAGRHGLFTYHLLRGLKGAADLDGDGMIRVWELCTYARGEVLKVAREVFGNEQEPLCVPGTGEGATVRIQPLAAVN